MGAAAPLDTSCPMQLHLVPPEPHFVPLGANITPSLGLPSPKQQHYCKRWMGSSTSAPERCAPGVQESSSSSEQGFPQRGGWQPSIGKLVWEPLS